MLHRLLGYLHRLVHTGQGGKGHPRRRTAPALSGGFPDVDWSMRVRNIVLADACRAADAVVRSCPLGQVVPVAYLGFDRERGSLLLRLDRVQDDRDTNISLTLAVDDPVTAANLEAAAALGGLHVVLTRAGEGRLLVEGLWENQRLLLYGIPAVRSPLDAF